MKTPAKDIIADSPIKHLAIIFGVCTAITTGITIFIVTVIAYAVSPYLFSLLLILYPIQYSVMHGLFLFATSYAASLHLQDEDVTLHDALMYGVGSIPDAFSTPLLVLTKRESTQRYMAYVDTIFTNKALHEAYAGLEDAPDAIGGTYSRHNVIEGVGIVVLFAVFFGLSLLTPSLTPLIFLYVFLWLAASFSFWFYGKAKQHIDRTALYIYLKTGRILTPYTYEDLQKRIQ